VNDATVDEFSFKVKFENDNHRIDSETYIKSLIAMTTIIKEFNYQIGVGEKVNVNIEAESAGSFEVSLVLTALKDLVSKDTVQYLGELVVLLTGIVELKKRFSKIDQTKTQFVENNVIFNDSSGNTIHTINQNHYHFYMNPVAHEAVSDQFRALEADKNITGIQYQFNDQKVTISSSEFGELAKPSEFIAPDSKETEAPATLTITRCVFEGENRKWEFILNGMKISAAILDRDFWKGIDRGNRFGKGDKLIVDLLTIRTFDPSLGVYINKEYQVLNVRDHQPRLPNDQLTLDPDTE